MQSKELYQLCFPEDTEQFVDYYYREKCRDNRIAAACCDSRMAAMAHANPYRMSLCGNPVKVHYIVAVATHPDYRRKGVMRALLTHVLRECAKREEPFGFLMPADPAYYTSLGYRFWNGQREWVMEARALEACQKELRLGPPAGKELSALARFANRLQAERFDLFVHRDAAYYRRLRKEQQSEDGDVIVARGSNGTLVGTFCYDREGGTVQIREPLMPGYAAEQKRPLMMGRILHLRRFVENLCFSTEFAETIRVKDDIIPDNNGCFRIAIGKDGGTISPAKEHGAAEAMDIAELSKILFGRMRIFVNELV